MAAIPRSGVAQPRGQNKGICSNFTHHLFWDLMILKQ